MLCRLHCANRLRLIKLVPLLTCFPLHLSPPQPVNVSLVNVSRLVTLVMEVMMVMTLLTMSLVPLPLVMVTGSQGTGPCLPPLSASLDNDNNNHYLDENYGNLSLVKNIQ